MRLTTPLSVAMFAAALGCAAGRAGTLASRPTHYDVFAVRYATIERFATSNLIAGADTSRRTDIAMSVWVAKGPGAHAVLMDAGFYRDKFITRWKPKEYERPSVAIGRVGLKPEDITDIIVSHIHWDHADGVDLFPRARVWIQRDEYEHYIDSTGRARSGTIDAADAAMLFALAKAGRVQLIDGDSVEILPGIRVYTGGKHTFASQFATVETDAGPVVLASDNAYLYENLDQRRPIAQTLDSLSNLRAQERMKRLAGAPQLIVPGHDPAVFTRFPLPGNGVARIR